MHAAAAAADSGTARTVWHIRAYVGDACTNNQAEYQGLVVALRLAKREWNTYQAASAGATSTKPQQKQQLQHRNNVLIVQGDSKLIIEQLKGVYQCRSDKLKSSYREAKALLDDFSKHCQVSLEHVYRAQNKAADGTYSL